MQITPEGFDIRFSEPEDLAFLQQWLSEPGACRDFPFEETEKDEALKNWIGFAKYKASLTGVLKEEPVAIGTLFLMPYRKVAHHCSFQLIVDARHRRQGIGTSMVRNLLHLAKTRFRLESVHVELYLPSPLLGIAQRLRFEEFARQDDYVRLNGRSHPRLLMEHFFHG
jgi:putative acetyltransferase